MSEIGSVIVAALALIGGWRVVEWAMDALDARWARKRRSAAVGQLHWTPAGLRVRRPDGSWTRWSARIEKS